MFSHRILYEILRNASQKILTFIVEFKNALKRYEHIVSEKYI